MRNNVWRVQQNNPFQGGFVEVEEIAEEICSLAREVNRIVRGRCELQPREEARRKLFTTESAKPGELLELIQVLERWGERWEVADELADVTYYICQLGIDEWVEALSRLAELLGFTADEAFQFARIKYGERVRTGKKDKKAEGACIRMYVETIQLRQTDNQAASEELRRILREAK